MNTNIQDKQYARTVAIIFGIVFVIIAVVVAFVIPTDRTTAAEADSQATSSSFFDAFRVDIMPDEQTDDASDEDISENSRCTESILNNNLTRGDRREAVADLQRFLNEDPDTQVAESGPGSPGREVSVYNQNTAQAVTRFQQKYLGNTSREPGTWGLQERMQARRLCADNEVGQSDNDQDASETNEQDNTQERDEVDNNERAEDAATEEGTESAEEQSSENTRRSVREYAELEEKLTEDELAMYINNRDQLFGEEAVLTDFDLRRRGDLRERETDRIADIEFDVASGDVLVGRVDLSFVHTGEGGDDEPWKVMRSVSIYNDGEKIASADAGSENNWLDDGSDYDGPLAGDEQFTIRVNNLKQIIERGDNADLSVRITAQDSVDDAGETAWGLFVDDGGVRMVDAEGVRKQIGDDSDTVTFDIDEGRDIDKDPRLEVERSYRNPDSSVIPVKANEVSDPFSIFAFDLDTDDVPVNIEQVNLRFDIKNRSNQAFRYQDIVNETALVVDDTVYELSRITLQDATNNRRSYNLAFATDGLSLDDFADETVRLVVRFNQVAGNDSQGKAVRAVVNSGAVRAANNITNKTGTPGAWHILRMR